MLRDLRTLNPNRRSHREKFVEECDVSLEVCNLEDDSNNVEMCNDRVALENTDKRITWIFKKARSKAEGEKTGIRANAEKRCYRSTMLHWRLLLQRAQGKDITNLKTNKILREA